MVVLQIPGGREIKRKKIQVRTKGTKVANEDTIKEFPVRQVLS
jgi:hypothetical protein